MRLVRLEIKGFKSFAKDTVLHFGADVIGVVGPNGSGKSNIVDAIRWVLGEQKRGELRLDKMSGVLFNGTKHRKPAGVAQVFLTFDNDRGVLRSDFQTVTVGRLLYRNGDSEYRLNGVTCRRKDITDLFVDTGIESNSYAIIALGMVDDILADHDNSRLRMLEQAAGISVYKARKRETLSRLTRTQEDLDRVNDLLFEIDGQLASLEKQARRARKHQELKAAYRQASIDYAAASASQLAAQLAEVTGELERAEAFAKTKHDHQEQLDARIERAREDLLTEEQHLAEDRRRMGVIQGKLRQATSERQLAEQKLAYVTQNRERLEAQHSHLTGERARLTTLLETRERQRASALDQEAAAREAHDAATERLGAARTQAEGLRTADRARAEAVRLADRQLNEIDQRIAVAQGRLQTLVQETAARERRAEQESQRLQDLARTQATAQADAEREQEALLVAEGASRARAVARERLRTRLDESAAALRERRDEQRAAEHEAGLLRAMLDRLEGSSQSVKYLADKLGWRGRFERLADVLDVDEPYRAAVEHHLGGLLGCYVVPDAATAAEGLRVLAEAGQAPTTILIARDDPGTREVPGDVTTAEPTASPNQPLGERALAHVQVAEPYRALVARLLRHVYIGERPGANLALPDGVAVVDPASLQIWWSDRARGGARAHAPEAQTGRRKRLAQTESLLARLTEEVERVQAERHEIERALREARAADDEQTIRGLRTRVQAADREVASAQARYESALAQQADREQLGRESEARARLLETDLARLRAKRAPAAAAVETARQAQASGGDALETAGQVLAEASASYNATKLALVQQENALAALDREIGYAREQVADVGHALAEATGALGHDGSEATELSARIEALAARIGAGRHTRDEHDARLRERESAFAAGRERLTGDEREARQLQRDAAEAGALVARLRERRGELQFRRANLAERLRIEFALELDEVLATPLASAGPLAELESRLARQRARLEGYGEVNPLAVEAYDAMAERRAGIDEQRADILAAVADLEATVTEIDRNATEQLTEAFEAVRGHFVDVFRHLFDAEDTADMVMLDPENPLESKIEIIAKPKGKRPQSIAQLSGGEKTLTATAFLFALYLIKPAPFCIFDEVDAPLDDANVEKFNRIIKRFSGKSQFIVVTHNKLTMAAVQTIYGVYMPELGVSQVTPVDFREFAHQDALTAVG